MAFHVPCLTTTLAGFGVWADEMKAAGADEAVNGQVEGLSSVCHLDTDGVEVIPRTDYNFSEVADRIAGEILGFAALDRKRTDIARRAAATLAAKAEWKHFIKYYYKAYDVALRKAAERLNK